LTPSPAALRSELRNVPESRVSSRSEFELREVPSGTGTSQLKFTGFASVTDSAYSMEDAFGEFTETVCRGAFSKTIADGCDTVFNLNHGGLSLARTKSGTLKLSEVTEGSRSPIYGVTGLHCEAMLDPSNHLVQAMRSAVERGDLDELSFAFRVVRQRWNKDFSDRQIDEVNLNQGDCSLVTFAANPATGGTVSLRQRPTGRSRRAEGDNCNRCSGEGTIQLGGKSITCPQCGGTGSSEGNSVDTSDDDASTRNVFALDAELVAQRSRLRLYLAQHPDLRRQTSPLSPRLRLEQLRHPPR
jgi:HK97 family phage prohead protease